MPDPQERLIGCLWGTAVGDALGLCREGLSRRRGAKLYPDTEHYQLFGGRGLGSDDTEHAVITAWALLNSEDDLGRFEMLLRQGLRRWFLSLPAGIGWATLRAGCKMTVGLSQPGVFSAGNGPVMRAAILGAWAVDHAIDLPAWVSVSSRLTHTDPRATAGALLIAQLTRTPEGLASSDPFFQEILDDVRAHPEETTGEFAQRRGWHKGITGFVYPTVAIAVQACLRHPEDFAAAVKNVIECGGDTDTTAAIVGGVLGARLGPSAIPSKWLESHKDWPASLAFMQHLPQERQLPSYPACLARNLLFGGAILGYGLRRLLPPY